METRSEAFDNAVRSGGRAVFHVDAVRNGVTIYPDVPFVGSPTVRVAGSGIVRRTFRGVVADRSLVPVLETDPLSVYGTELHARCGFLLAGGEETVAAGVFRLQDIDPDSTGPIEVQGDDRAVVVEAAALESPEVVADGTNIVTAIKNIIGPGYPNLTYIAEPTPATAALTVFEEGTGRVSAAQKLAAAAGMEVFFSPAGNVVIRAVPDTSTVASVWDYSPGPGSLLITAKSRQSGRPIRNVVVGIAEGAGIPTLRSVAEVTDTTSPVHPSKVGRAVHTFRTTIATTQTQLDVATEAELRRQLGRSELLEFVAAPHPAHEVGDVVRVAESSIHLDVLAVLSGFSFDLDLLSETQYQTIGRRAA